MHLAHCLICAQVRCLGGEKCVLMHYKNAGGKPGFVGITPARPADIVALDCVEINQCDGRTRQFFAKSFLGDDAAVLALSSGEEPASPRHRADVASMAWRTTQRFSTNAT